MYVDHEEIKFGYLETMDEPSWQLSWCQLCQAVSILPEMTLPSRSWHPTVWTKETREANAVLGRVFKICPTDVALVAVNILEVLLCVVTQYHSLTRVPLISFEVFELEHF